MHKHDLHRGYQPELFTHNWGSVNGYQAMHDARLGADVLRLLDTVMLSIPCGANRDTPQRDCVQALGFCFSKGKATMEAKSVG